MDRERITHSMETLCWKCENLIARHGAAAHDLSQVAEALTHQAKTGCSNADRDAALAKVIMAEERCASLRAMISAHIVDHTRAGKTELPASGLSQAKSAAQGAR
jgi:hypothetical protein